MSTPANAILKNAVVSSMPAVACIGRRTIRITFTTKTRSTFLGIHAKHIPYRPWIY